MNTITEPSKMVKLDNYFAPEELKAALENLFIVTIINVIMRL
ncbi:hypothetical protein [Empedobacter sp.]|nr:hypothetical protein [Empedobacter sp.]